MDSFYAFDIYLAGQEREWKGSGLLTFVAARRDGVWQITTAHASTGSGILESNR